MGEVIVEKGEVLKVYFVCATAVQSQLFSFADLFLYELQKSYVYFGKNVLDLIFNILF